jgi:hypothetical protein
MSLTITQFGVLVSDILNAVKRRFCLRLTGDNAKYSLVDFNKSLTNTIIAQFGPFWP